MKKLLFVINVGWYYRLHWQERMQSKLVDNYDLSLCMSKTEDISNTHEIDLERSSISLLSNIKTIIQINNIFREINPDFIHSVTVKPNIILGIMALWYKKPIIMTIPGLGSMFSQKLLKSRFLSYLILKLYRIISKNKNSFFIFENQTDQELFVTNNICNNSNSRVVPGSGVDVNEYKSEPIKIDDSKLKILFASRLLKGKGLYELVSAVDKMKNNGFQVELNVAGIIDCDSTEAISLNEIEKWHNDGIINWLGQVNQNMNRVIASNDVVVLPTQYGEGLPRILIEANSCSRAIITTDIGGCKDFVKDGVTGILISQGNDEELYLALNSMLDRKFCQKLGINGREHVLANYTIEHVINHYCSIYKKNFYSE
ncbi:TPA: glycosyltransferase family 4 protein [Photobacterium damselae]